MLPPPTPPLALGCSAVREGGALVAVAHAEVLRVLISSGECVAPTETEGAPVTEAPAESVAAGERVPSPPMALLGEEKGELLRVGTPAERETLGVGVRVPGAAVPVPAAWLFREVGVAMVFGEGVKSAVGVAASGMEGDEMGEAVPLAEALSHELLENRGESEGIKDGLPLLLLLPPSPTRVPLAQGEALTLAEPGGTLDTLPLPLGAALPLPLRLSRC